MAPPFRWFDAFVAAGWSSVLSPAALRVVLNVARRIDRHSRTTRMSLERLQREAGLPRRTFYRSKSELVGAGLLERVKIGGRWTLTLISPVPVPPTASESASRGTRKCHPWHKKVPPMAPPNGQKPRRRRNPADPRQETEMQLEGKTEVQEGSAVREYLATQGVQAAFSVDFAAAVRSIAAFPEGDVRTSALDDAAFSLSRRLQSQGVLWPEVKVRSLLGAAVAIANGAIQEKEAAVRTGGAARILCGVGVESFPADFPPVLLKAVAMFQGHGVVWRDLRGGRVHDGRQTG